MNQNDCSGKTPKPWPVFVDHYKPMVILVEPQEQALALLGGAGALMVVPQDKRGVLQSMQVLQAGLEEVALMERQVVLPGGIMVQLPLAQQRMVMDAVAAGFIIQPSVMAQARRMVCLAYLLWSGDMLTFAVIEGDMVTNTIEWDGQEDWLPPEGAEVVEFNPEDTLVGVGFQYINGKFITPKVEPPAN
ncbi:hypothetical protein [Enterobacter sp. C4G1]|uniref:hypothetical protein n=1 Tax=Enterobacter sp. C4G1 TaxID=3458724 RepID=UPI004067E8BF